MFKNNKKLIFILILVAIGGFLLLSPALAAPTKALDNPLGTTDINALIGRVIKGVLGIVGSLALLMIIYGGFTMLTSGGAEQKINKAKGIIVWAIIGLVVIFLSYAILNAVLGVLTTGTSSNQNNSTTYSGCCVPTSSSNSCFGSDGPSSCGSGSSFTFQSQSCSSIAGCSK